MNWSHWRLRDKIFASHLLVAAAGAVTFLITTLVLGLGLSKPSVDDVSTRLYLVAAVSALVGLIVSGIVARVASKWLFAGIAAPARRMATMAHRLAKGNYSERVLQADRGSAPDDMDEADEAIKGLISALDDLAMSLEAAEQRRTLSFGEVAHEIRTPVAVLEGYLEGLLDGHVKPSEETWAMLYDEASRVHRLVDELQELSRLESRQMLPDLEAVEPASIARGAVERMRLHFEEKGLRVTTDIAPDLPLVLADPDQALQILVNLLTNSLRYTPAPGQVTLSVSRLAGTNEVVFSLTDTGVGIAAEHIPHLFERFFRIDRAGNRKLGGSGIGLPVAKALVEAMGGRIWAESAGAGHGSTFSFTLLIATT